MTHSPLFPMLILAVYQLMESVTEDQWDIFDSNVEEKDSLMKTIPTNCHHCQMIG